MSLKFIVKAGEHLCKKDVGAPLMGGKHLSSLPALPQLVILVKTLAPARKHPCGLIQECALMLLPLYCCKGGERLEGVWAEDS